MDLHELRRRRIQRAGHADHDGLRTLAEHTMADLVDLTSPSAGGDVDQAEEDADAAAVRDQLLGVRHDPWAPTGSPNPENIPLPDSRGSTPPSSPRLAPTDPPPTAPEAPDDDDEPICRICFASSSDPDPDVRLLGRLIRPCLCKGTQALVHVGCLQRWRRNGASRKSFWKCDQCGFCYRLRRTKVAGLAENKLALGCMTLAVFMFLVTLAGYVAGYLVDASLLRDATPALPALDPPSAAYPAGAGGGGWTWSVGIGPLYYDSSGRLMGDALGEAVRVLNNKLNVDSLAPPSSSSAHGTSSSSHDDDTASPPPLQRVASSDSAAYRYRRSPLASDRSTSSHPTADSEAQEDEEEGQGTTLPPWMLDRLQRIISHQILGLAFVGIMSFFQLVVSLTFFSPFNYTLRNTLFRVIRGNRRDGDGAGLGSAMILLMVLTGTAKALHATWKAVGVVSHYILSRVEDHVLDVR